MFKIDLIITMRDHDDDHNVVEGNTPEELLKNIWNLIVVALSADATASFRFEPADDRFDELLSQLGARDQSDS